MCIIFKIDLKFELLSQLANMLLEQLRWVIIYQFREQQFLWTNIPALE